MQYRNLLAAALFTLGSITTADYAVAGKASLRGSREAMDRENYMANSDNLTRIRDDAQLYRFVDAGLLQPLDRNSRTYSYAGNSRYGFSRPWAKTFVQRLSSQYYSRFGRKMRISSAVRPVKYHNHLRNRNISRRSTHPTGATIDISKRYMSLAGKQWMRRALLELEGKGVLQATEEHRQPCFHVMVYRDEYRAYVERITKKHGKRR